MKTLVLFFVLGCLFTVSGMLLMSISHLTRRGEVVAGLFGALGVMLLIGTIGAIPPAWWL